MDIAFFWDNELVTRLLFPLLRLLLFMSIGLLVANIIEVLHWTRYIARLSSPLVRLAHMHSVAAASFSIAFFSPATANAMLADAYKEQKITRRELIFANLFNSTPTFLVHLPSLVSLIFAFLGVKGFIYIGLTFLAASLRTVITVICGRIFLPPIQNNQPPSTDQPSRPWREVLQRSLRRCRKRIGKLLIFTIPIYCLVYVMHNAGLFQKAEQFMAENITFLNFLKPEALSIIILHLAAESGAALSVASSLANTNTLSMPEIIISMLIGNIISSPMRAIRHQFPSYAGFFAPSLALTLVILNQICRVASLIVVTLLYYLAVFP